MQGAQRNFEAWKEFLHKGVELAKKAGASEAKIEDVATKFGDYLAKNVDPANSEQALLKNLWEQGSPDEQKVLAGLITRMVSDGVKH